MAHFTDRPLNVQHPWKTTLNPGPPLWIPPMLIPLPKLVPNTQDPYTHTIIIFIPPLYCHPQHSAVCSTILVCPVVNHLNGNMYISATNWCIVVCVVLCIIVYHCIVQSLPPIKKRSDSIETWIEFAVKLYHKHKCDGEPPLYVSHC